MSMILRRNGTPSYFYGIRVENEIARLKRRKVTIDREYHDRDNSLICRVPLDNSPFDGFRRLSRSGKLYKTRLSLSNFLSPGSLYNNGTEKMSVRHLRLTKRREWRPCRKKNSRVWLALLNTGLERLQLK
jgi:hypothetical protein